MGLKLHGMPIFLCKLRITNRHSGRTFVIDSYYGSMGDVNINVVVADPARPSQQICTWLYPPTDPRRFNKAASRRHDWRIRIYYIC